MVIISNISLLLLAYTVCLHAALGTPLFLSLVSRWPEPALSTLADYLVLFYILIRDILVRSAGARAVVDNLTKLDLIV